MRVDVCDFIDSYVDSTEWVSRSFHFFGGASHERRNHPPLCHASFFFLVSVVWTFGFDREILTKGSDGPDRGGFFMRSRLGGRERRIGWEKLNSLCSYVLDPFPQVLVLTFASKIRFSSRYPSTVILSCRSKTSLLVDLA